MTDGFFNPVFLEWLRLLPAQWLEQLEEQEVLPSTEQAEWIPVGDGTVQQYVPFLDDLREASGEQGESHTLFDENDYVNFDIGTIDLPLDYQTSSSANSEPPELLRTFSEIGSLDDGILEPMEVTSLLYPPMPPIPDAGVVIEDLADSHANTREETIQQRPLKWQKTIVAGAAPAQCGTRRPLLPKPGETDVEFTWVGKKTKRRRFSDDGRAKVRGVRKDGACMRCRMLKKSCTPVASGGCCENCRKNTNPRVWSQPCVRIKLTELVIYQSDEWMSILESITKTMAPRAWARGSFQLDITSDNDGPVLRFQLSKIQNPLDSISRNEAGEEIELKSFALKKGPGEISIREFDAFVDGLTRKCTDRIFVNFLSSLLKETVEYADRTNNDLVCLALRYYFYCRLTHGFLRGICYEGYNGGVGVGVWIRRMFKWDVLSPELRCQILLFVSARTKNIEKELFSQIERQLGIRKQGAFIPALLALSILVDQMDCNVHEGRWLTEPAENMVCPRKAKALHYVPTEALGQALTTKATDLGSMVVKFARIINERVLSLEQARAKGKPMTEDAKFYLNLRDKLRGPRCHLPKSTPTYLEQLLFLDEPNKHSPDNPHILQTCNCTEILLKTRLRTEPELMASSFVNNWQRPFAVDCNCPRLDFLHDRSFEKGDCEGCERMVVWGGQVQCMSIVEGEAHSRFSIPRERGGGLSVRSLGLVAV